MKYKEFKKELLKDPRVRFLCLKDKIIRKLVKFLLDRLDINDKIYFIDKYAIGKYKIPTTIDNLFELLPDKQENNNK